MSNVIGQTLSKESAREALKEYDQLLLERRDPATRLFVGLREGEFWRFKCSYKYKLGEVDKYRCVARFSLRFQGVKKLLNKCYVIK